MTSLLVVSHSREDVLGPNRGWNPSIQAYMTDHRLDPIDQVRAGETLAVGQASSGDQADGYCLAVVDLSTRCVLDSIAERVTEVEIGPLALLLVRISLDYRDLDLDGLGDERLKVGEHAGKQSRQSWSTRWTRSVPGESYSLSSRA